MSTAMVFERSTFTASYQFPPDILAGFTRTSSSVVSVGWARSNFPSLRTTRFHISCATEQAKPETVQKVCEIVSKQLALAPDSELIPETKFSALGADSLDTVEIAMGLEEEFDITVEEESSENITMVQEAAEFDRETH
ncbi:Acyl carrier protein [Quillaja saponaria]|uniref:Acyl carrier protein n=1 Tax=Quillaja saponaria TaxID=32244 RepID=A0AAD7LFT3_QUISA|nr:Acyl carrier protein [Quillaja saponaria]